MTQGRFEGPVAVLCDLTPFIYAPANRDDVAVSASLYVLEA